MVKVAHLTTLGAALMSVAVVAQEQSPKAVKNETATQPAASVEPIAAIIEAFQTHSLVPNGNVEFTGGEQCHSLFRSLVRDPRFAANVNHIVSDCRNYSQQFRLDLCPDARTNPSQMCG